MYGLRLYIAYVYLISYKGVKYMPSSPSILKKLLKKIVKHCITTKDSTREDGSL